MSNFFLRQPFFFFFKYILSVLLKKRDPVFKNKKTSDIVIGGFQ